MRSGGRLRRLPIRPHDQQHGPVTRTKDYTLAACGHEPGGGHHLNDKSKHGEVDAEKAPDRRSHCS